MPFLDEIATHLITSGVGVYGSSIFLGSKAVIPALNSDATKGTGPYLSILETGGSAPTRVQNRNGATTQRPTAQIVVRALSYQVARTMARAAYLALDGLFNVTIGGTRYLRVTARQEPTDIGLDDAGRPMVAFNIDAEKEPS